MIPNRVFISLKILRQSQECVLHKGQHTPTEWRASKRPQLLFSKEAHTLAPTAASGYDTVPFPIADTHRHSSEDFNHLCIIKTWTLVLCYRCSNSMFTHHPTSILFSPLYSTILSTYFLYYLCCLYSIKNIFSFSFSCFICILMKIIEIRCKN